MVTTKSINQNTITKKYLDSNVLYITRLIENIYIDYHPIEHFEIAQREHFVHS